MTTERAYKLEDSVGCLISGIFTEKELNRFADAGWAVVEELNPEDYKIGRVTQ
ncbi:MAG: hypothetical protein PHR77_03225 [Kiritimatiellae bacterium]|nr:hypothetical protein [Kiritimatiellia bacterium]MDD5519569.1 hypothetical protein [Kiritimatiellia bacterium]